MADDFIPECIEFSDENVHNLGCLLRVFVSYLDIDRIVPAAFGRDQFVVLLVNFEPCSGFPGIDIVMIK